MTLTCCYYKEEVETRLGRKLRCILCTELAKSLCRRMRNYVKMPMMYLSALKALRFFKSNEDVLVELIIIACVVPASLEFIRGPSLTLLNETMIT